MAIWGKHAPPVPDEVRAMLDPGSAGSGSRGDESELASLIDVYKRAPLHERGVGVRQRGFLRPETPYSSDFCALLHIVERLDARVKELEREWPLSRIEALKVGPEDTLVVTFDKDHENDIESDVARSIKTMLGCKAVLLMPEGVTVGTKQE